MFDFADEVGVVMCHVTSELCTLLNLTSKDAEDIV